MAALVGNDGIESRSIGSIPSTQWPPFQGLWHYPLQHHHPQLGAAVGGTGSKPGRERLIYRYTVHTVYISRSFSALALTEPDLIDFPRHSIGLDFSPRVNHPWPDPESHANPMECLGEPLLGVSIHQESTLQLPH